jgi:hypothetical protein
MCYKYFLNAIPKCKGIDSKFQEIIVPKYNSWMLFPMLRNNSQCILPNYTCGNELTFVFKILYYWYYMILFQGPNMTITYRIPNWIRRYEFWNYLAKLLWSFIGLNRACKSCYYCVSSIKFKCLN